MTVMGIFMEKTCFKCGHRRPIGDFYKHKMMADGHLNKCKECTKQDTKENRDAKIEYYKRYDAWRFKNDPKVKARHAIYRMTENYAKSSSASKDRWINRNPEARAAHVILNNAVRDGRIEKPDLCSCCGMFTPSRMLHGHHHDYTKPLDVTWLCVFCHSAIHKMND